MQKGNALIMWDSDQLMIIYCHPNSFIILPQIPHYEAEHALEIKKTNNINNILIPHNKSCITKNMRVFNRHNQLLTQETTQ
jgi:aspartate carbamoyltransferase regulatory subunit